MDGTRMMTTLARTIDDHAWDELPALLHDDFRCTLVHTGETFDKDGWGRFNADYPGFESMQLLDCVGSAGRAAGRSEVRGLAGERPATWQVASFLTLREGLVVELVEVWAEVDQAPPAGTRGEEA